MKNKKLLFLLLIIPLLVVAYFLAVNIPHVLNTAQKIFSKESNVYKDYTSESALINPLYYTDETIVANYTINKTKFDGTNNDAAVAINSALTECYTNGGGTVYLPSGTYTIKSQINVPDGCTLRGEYQDPDRVGDRNELKYGTILKVDISSTVGLDAIIKINSGSGVVGLTFYFNNLTIDKMRDYDPWTIYYNDLTSDATVKDITFINAPNGIGKYAYLNDYTDYNDTNEPKNVVTWTDTVQVINIENVKGTVLKHGIALVNSQDVGTVNNVTLNPKYWANANQTVLGASSLPTEDAILKYMSATDTEHYYSNNINYSYGLLIESQELQEFSNLSFDGYYYGIYMYNRNNHQNNGKSRAQSSFVCYDLNITNASYGIYSEPDSIDPRYGVLISKGSIRGSMYAIYNEITVDSNNNKPMSINNTDGTTTYKMGNSGWVATSDTDELIETIKLNGVSVYGNVGGPEGKTGDIFLVTQSENEEMNGKISLTVKYSDKQYTTNTEHKTYGSAFKELDSSATVKDINKALQDVANTGGGVVYLKPGEYLINDTIIIPKNTELRGSNAVSNAYYGKQRQNYDRWIRSCTDNRNCFNTKGEVLGTVFTVTANITPIAINGDNAGVSGINIGYSEIISKINASSKDYNPSGGDRACNGLTCYTKNGAIDVTNGYDMVAIQAQGFKNPYVSNVTIIGAKYGINFINCDNFLVKNVVSTVFNKLFIIEDSTNGTVMNVIQNGTFLENNRLYPFETNLGIDQANPNPKQMNILEMLNDLSIIFDINSSTNITAKNIFTFASRNTVNANNSTFTGINIIADRHYAKSSLALSNDYSMFNFNVSSGNIFNVISNGYVFYNSTPRYVSLYNLAYMRREFGVNIADGMGKIVGGMQVTNLVSNSGDTRISDFDKYNDYHINKEAGTFDYLSVGSIANDIDRIMNNFRGTYKIYRNTSDGKTIELTGTDVLHTGDKVEINDTTIYNVSIIGDVNKDGLSDLQDVTVLYRAYRSGLVNGYTGLESCQEIAGNIKDDNLLDLNDVTLLYRKYRKSIGG